LRLAVGRLKKRIGRSLSRKLTRVTLDRFIASHASAGLTLDLGAQAGPYARHFPRRVGLDLRHSPGIAVVGDARALPFHNDVFDVVLCTEMLEHVPEPQAAIDEMWRVLRPGGLLVLTTRFLFPIHDAPHDYFRFTKYGLRHLLRRFEVVQLQEETDSVGTLAVLVQRLGMQAHTLGSSSLRAVWLVAARVMLAFSGVISDEFGDVQRRVPERGIMTSGYHMACRKPIR
jgi:SAM-dependent methyltransferase